MTMNERTPLLALACALLLAATLPRTARANLIDVTYGAGVGSFEVGSFTPRGTGSNNFQSLLAGATNMTGWTIGGTGVDWLSAPAYGASDGIRAVDLGWYTGGAGSVSIVLPTVTGATYSLTFGAAAVSGLPTYTNGGRVTAGSLVNAAFAPTFTGGSNFSGQTFYTQSFSFTALSASTLLTIAATTPTTAYGPVIDNVDVQFVSGPAAVPVPAAAGLLASALGMLGIARRRGRE